MPLLLPPAKAIAVAVVGDGGEVSGWSEDFELNEIGVAGELRCANVHWRLRAAPRVPRGVGLHNHHV